MATARPFHSTKPCSGCRNCRKASCDHGGVEKSRYPVPKKRFLAAPVIRKLANGHSTATKESTNSGPASSETSHGFQLFVVRSSRSMKNAGTINSNGNGGGIN